METRSVMIKFIVPDDKKFLINICIKKFDLIKIGGEE